MHWGKTQYSPFPHLLNAFFPPSSHRNPMSDCSLQGTDVRDALLAQIFGCAALVRSGRVQSQGDADVVTTILLGAAGRKAFLREVAAEVLLEMIGTRCHHMNQAANMSQKISGPMTVGCHYADALGDANVAPQLLASSDALRNYLKRAPSDSTPEVGHPASVASSHLPDRSHAVSFDQFIITSANFCCTGVAAGPAAVASDASGAAGSLCAAAKPGLSRWVGQLGLLRCTGCTTVPVYCR